MRPSLRTFLGTLLTLLALDQATKLAIVAGLREDIDRIVIVPGFFDLVHAENRAASFGMMADLPYRYVMFAVLGVTMALACGLTAARLPPEERLVGAALGSVASGALGNAIDRVWKGSVTDFLRVHVEHGALHDALVSAVGTSEWPSFNVADSALVVGVGLFLLRLGTPDEEDGTDGDATPPSPAG